MVEKQNLNDYQIIQILERMDLEHDAERLLQFVSMGKNVLVDEGDVVEGKRVTCKGRDIALSVTRTTGDVAFYNVYNTALLVLARYFHDFDSYMLFVEKNREPRERFYLPRRRVMQPLVQAMQDLLDDKLDILTISVAPGTGKMQPLSSLVLTPNGFTEMRYINVGSEVVSENGRIARVIQVFPHKNKNIYKVTLVNGKSFRCGLEHMHYVKYGSIFGKPRTVNTLAIMNCIFSVYFPMYDPKTSKMYWIKCKSVVLDGKEDAQCIYIDDESHLYITDNYIFTHNTTLEEFFISFFMGLYPDKPNLFSSYSDTITTMFHKSVHNIITNPEYAWGDIFWDVPFESKSDKDETINLGKYKPFKTLTCRSLSASLTGVTRCEGILACDDMVSGLEVALSPLRLQKLYDTYTTDLRSRKKLGAKEIHIATRWSVHDIIGHLQQIYDGSDRARFISMPCYDENGESQFNFDFGVGFDTAYFKDIEKSMDDISFRCLYLNDPIEREGLLYPPDSIQTYLNGLPKNADGTVRDPDAIWGCCDTKDTGTDYNCLLVVFQYGQQFYLEDVVYNNGSPYVIDELNANCLVRNHVQQCRFESNKEGSRTANEVERLVKEKGGVCNITKKYTTANKETKIIVNSDWVKKHIMFKDPSCYERKSEYGQFMMAVHSYVQMGKNAHDDAPDCLAMLALFIDDFNGTKATVMSRSELGF